MGIEVCNHDILGHGGSTVGFTGEFYICPAKGIGIFRISNVNAILDYTSEGWQDIGAVNNQIKTMLMRKIGMLPLVDYIVLFPMAGSIVMLIRNRRRILEQLSERFNFGAENTS